VQIDAVFERNDRDGDGKLSKEEFTEMMCKSNR
jgi:Ca2+-binding EF-hand superfamily protein